MLFIMWLFIKWLFKKEESALILGMGALLRGVPRLSNHLSYVEN